ncbi:MAG: type II toxin-antitoxin system VapC family toxin [Shinella sp.]|uniref:type II toxin-antitoxin system VapC family toxin n=1 Tax=Shinella sp. TaxID=1870904 RepID=UPI003C72756F
MSSGFLLDTCAVIWMSQRLPISEAAAHVVSDARDSGVPIHVSAVTAWEMGMLVAHGRISETKEPKRWYDEFLAGAGLSEIQVTADIFMAASFLPLPLHKDPIDRIIIATARGHDLTIITRDRAILAYSVAGHVRALAC